MGEKLRSFPCVGIMKKRTDFSTENLLFSLSFKFLFLHFTETNWLKLVTLSFLILDTPILIHSLTLGM